MAITTPKAAHDVPDQQVRSTLVPFPAPDGALVPAPDGALGRDGAVPPSAAEPVQDSRSRSKPPVRASGAWRDGDDPGHRLFADVGAFDLEAGDSQ